MLIPDDPELFLRNVQAMHLQAMPMFLPLFDQLTELFRFHVIIHVDNIGKSMHFGIIIRIGGITAGIRDTVIDLAAAVTEAEHAYVIMLVFRSLCISGKDCKTRFCNISGLVSLLHRTDDRLITYIMRRLKIFGAPAPFRSRTRIPATFRGTHQCSMGHIIFSVIEFDPVLIPYQ